MRRPALTAAGYGRILIPAALGAAAVAACSDQLPSPAREPLAVVPAQVLQAVECVGSTTARTLSCRPLGASTGGASGVLIGGQGTYVNVTSTNFSYNSGTEIFSFDVTVQNLLNEAIGTPDGTTADPEGIQLFFHAGPTVTSGSGNIDVANEDGTGTFTAAGQPYFQYNQILDKDEVSSTKTWQLNVDDTVETFSFTLFIQTDVQYLLVINEALTNPGGMFSDGAAEWFEIYNAGSRSVDLQNLVIADSSFSGGRRPYHRIASSLVVPAGGYAVLGRNTNTTTNGGVPVDYSYGMAINMDVNPDALKISRVYGTDTLTLDRTQYASAAISHKDGYTRELKNPSLDNSDMDGSNWADASGEGAECCLSGIGTPKAQNSTFTP